MPARLIGIAGRTERRGAMIETERSQITRSTGLEGDYKGAKHATRQITILAKEDWAAALVALGPEASGLPWTVRRANLLTEGLRLPQVKGAILSAGPVQLEVTGQTYPCHRMDEAFPGLLKALAPDWRGGVTCRVLSDGKIWLGETVSIISSPPEPPPRKLPG